MKCYRCSEKGNNVGVSSGPQSFWHQGPVSWKAVFPQVVRGMVQAVMPAMGSDGEGRGATDAAHLLLCGRGWGPLGLRTEK